MLLLIINNNKYEIILAIKSCEIEWKKLPLKLLIIKLSHKNIENNSFF